MLPIGSVLRLREPDPDSPYNRVRVSGQFDAGEAGVELILTPLDGFASPERATEDSLWTTGYEPEPDAAPAGDSSAWEAGP
jgi:hypothetical protein